MKRSYKAIKTYKVLRNTSLKPSGYIKTLKQSKFATCHRIIDKNLRFKRLMSPFVAGASSSLSASSWDLEEVAFEGFCVDGPALAAAPDFELHLIYVFSWARLR